MRMESNFSNTTLKSSTLFLRTLEMVGIGSPSPLQTFLSMLLLAFIFFVVKVNILKRSHPLPPGPTQWPITGSLHALFTSKPVFRWIHRLMHEMNTEIICIRFLNTHVIAVSSDDLAKEFLKRQDTAFSSRPICLAAEITSGKYLSAALGPMGEQWKKMRRILASEILSQNRHKWLLNKRNEEADNLVRYVYNQTCGSQIGSVVNVRVAAQHYCGNVIRKLIFNKRFFGAGMEDGGPGVEEEEHVNALFTILAYLYSFCVSDYAGFLRGRLDLDGHEKFIRKAIESVRKYQDPLIDERAQQWKKGTKTMTEDLLDVMLSLKKEGGMALLSIDEIKAQVIELMIATVDNPSNAIEWAIAEMINRPGTLQRAIEELDRVVGTHRLVQESDLMELNYIKACAKEAFRLHPIAPFNIPHVAMSDTTVAGYFIPKGSHVLLSRPGLGRNPRIWDDPLTFNPERHLRDDGSEVALTDAELRLLSFSTGRRGCAGVLLGSTMTTMLLARLLQGFTWSTPPTKPRIDLSESHDSLLMARPLIALARPRLGDNLLQEIDGGGDKDSGCGAVVVPNFDEVKSISEGGGDCEEVEVGFVGSEFLHSFCLLEGLSSMEVLVSSMEVLERKE
ncbi:hypothetical protein LguiA_020776 [Lonicera macranthoides]